ncbi:MAG: TylF/MycF/NovP-related O-methyltransferase [Planctomycetota bacterium]
MEANPNPGGQPPQQQQRAQLQLNLLGMHEQTKVVTQQLHIGVWSVTGGGVPGDIVEFGTMSGMTAQVLAMGMAQMTVPNQPVRQLHLFDSFEGLPQATQAPDTESPHVQKGDWKPGGCTGISAEQLGQAVGRFLPAERVAIHAGWYSDTVTQLPGDTRFALLHVDCDMYSSTMDAIVPCFENGWVSAGAHLFFDDWNCNRADPRFGQRKAWAELTERFDITFSSGGDYGAFAHKMIVHGYTGCPED